VVPLLAREVRAIAGIYTKDKKGENINPAHAVDGEHDPLPENYAHALIVTAPHAATDGAFKRLKEALCRIAQPHGWSCPPKRLRV
jgi:hypothetical protein